MKFPNTHIAVFTYAGVEPDTMTCIIQELFTAQAQHMPMELSHFSEDALISRSRSRALSKLTRDDAPDVMVMIDRDIAWKPGDVGAIAYEAFTQKAVIGGIYSYRQLQAGISSRTSEAAPEIRVGGDKFHRADYLATGFLAIPKSAVDRMLECLNALDDLDGTSNETIRFVRGLTPEDKPFYDFFRPISVYRPAPGRLMGGPGADNETPQYEYLSEDWSFCHRAKSANVPLLLWEKPVLRHWARVPMMVPQPKSKIVGST